MSLVLIEETEDREISDAYQWAVEDFTEATQKVMEYLYGLGEHQFSTEVILRWCDGPHMVGKEQPFNIRVYHGPVGTWTDFMYRVM